MSKSCPNPTCSFDYTRKTKPANNVCPNCTALIGEFGAAQITKPKKDPNKLPLPTKHTTVYLGEGIFSVNYWQMNRCLGRFIFGCIHHHLSFIILVRMSSSLYDTGVDINFCSQKQCMDNRRKFIENAEKFVCNHIQKLLEDLDGDKVELNPTRFTASDLENLENLPPDVQSKIRDYVVSTSNFKAFKLTEFCIGVKTVPSNYSCIDFVHVTKKPSDERFKCVRGSGCDRFSVTVSKKTQAYSLCSHEHIVNILLATQPSQLVQSTPVQGTSSSSKHGDPLKPKQTEQLDENSGPTVNEEELLHQTPGTKQDDWLQQTSRYIFRNMKMDLSMEKMRCIERKLLLLHKSGFPSVFSPNLSECPVCESEISPPSKHRRVVTSNLLTRDNYETKM
jgi:hypothetical protein